MRYAIGPKPKPQAASALEGRQGVSFALDALIPMASASARPFAFAREPPFPRLAGRSPGSGALPHASGFAFGSPKRGFPSASLRGGRGKPPARSTRLGALQPLGRLASGGSPRPSLRPLGRAHFRMLRQDGLLRAPLPCPSCEAAGSHPRVQAAQKLPACLPIKTSSILNTGQTASIIIF